jgi:serine/threonine protein kinase
VNVPQTDTLHEELAAHLVGLDAGEGAGVYRVERLLKESDVEKTQLVYRREADGSESGPYVRKLISVASGIGGAYAILAKAGPSGRVAQILSCGEKDDVLEVLMEYVAGATLRESVCAAAPGMRPALASVLMPSICAAVTQLHEGFDEPIIHRDLTPDNIICPDNDPMRPVLIDLGIARAWHEGAETDTTHFGTRSYSPPEQFGFGQTDVRSDVYALGMLCFFCLTGRDPRPVDRERDFVDAVVPDDWRAVIRKAAALDPGARYQCVREFMSALPKAPLPLSGDAGVTEKEGRARLVNSRNVAVVLAWAVCCAASVSDFLDMRYAPDSTGPFRYFGFLVWIPYALTLVAWALLDKRWLCEHIPALAPGGRHLWPVLLGILVALLVVWICLAQPI